MSATNKRIIAAAGIVLVAGIGYWISRPDKSVRKDQKLAAPVPAPREAEPYDGTPRREAPDFVPSSKLPEIPDRPTDYQVAASRIFPTRLRAIGGSESENGEVAKILRRFRELDRREAFGELETWLRQNRESRWFPALKHELMSWKYKRGYFAEARDGWSELWEALKNDESPEAVAVGNEVLARLLDVSMGYRDAALLRGLVADIEEQEYRIIGGALEGKINRATEAVFLAEKTSAFNVMCGPLALHSILDFQDEDWKPIPLRNKFDSFIETGLPLTEVAKMATEHYGMDFLMVKPSGVPNEIPAPSVVHFRDEHFAAILGSRNNGDEVLLEDRNQDFVGWIDRNALDKLSSGYFLVASANVPDNWETVGQAEGRNIFGRDGWHPHVPTGPTCDDESCGGDEPCKGMPTYRFHPFPGSLRIEDIPLGYEPPVGPTVRFKINFNDLDEGAPVSAPAFANVGLTWSTDWIAWVNHVPESNLNNSTSIRIQVPGGGFRTVTGFTGNKSEPDQKGFATLTLSGDHTWTRDFPDGSKQIFNAPDDPSDPSRVFMTQSVDPQGNSLSFEYDAQMRLISVTDAIGQVTTLKYDHPTDPHKITSVTDPFERVCSLEYEGDFLAAVTDVIGLRSTFDYQPNGFPMNMTTPYGTTTFRKLQENIGLVRSLEVEDPNGDRERVMYNDSATGSPLPGNHTPPPEVYYGALPTPFSADLERLQFRNSYFWTKEAMAHAPGDFESSRNYRWFTDRNWRVVPFVEAIKEPLEERVWFNYPGQEDSKYAAGSDLSAFPENGGRPEKILRMLSDGTPQVYQTFYNEAGRLTKYIDPVGRVTELTYNSNGLDVKEIRQTSKGINELLASVVWNDRHLPTSFTDQAGQITTLAYNSRGQIETIVNAEDGVITFSYNSDGYLESLDLPLEGTADSFLLEYDSYGRVSEFTDINGFTRYLEYDDLDRLTKIIFPDGSTEEFAYDRLDMVAVKDRLNRVTTYEYDALRRRTSKEDPAGRTTHFDWCRCGDLKALIDPNGNATHWDYDVQGRVIRKILADDSVIEYEYDSAVSLVRKRTDEKGQLTFYDYHRDNTLKSKSYPNAIHPTPTVSFAFDPYYPRIRSMKDGIGSTRFEFGEFGSVGGGMLKTVDGPFDDDTIRYTYDRLGRRIGYEVNGDGESVTLDPIGRVIKRMNSAGIFSLSYFGSTGRMRRVEYPNGATTEYEYHNESTDFLLRSISHEAPDGSLTSEFLYDYNAVRRISEFTQIVPGAGIQRKWKIEYDDSNQMISVSSSDPISGNSLPQGGYSYTYDLAGNRISKTVDGQTTQYSYNSLNQLVSSYGPGEALFMNEDYEWDAENRLLAVNRASDGTRSEFKYDGLGRRVRYSRLSGDSVMETSSFVWDDLKEIEQRSGDGSAIELRYFENAMGYATLGSEVFLFRDHLGSVRSINRADGSVEEHYDFDPWGVRETVVAGAVSSSVGYTGHWMESSTGLLFAPYRAYSPNSARWVSRDPLEEMGGVNLYVYSINDPLNHVDPTGNIAWWILQPALGCLGSMATSFAADYLTECDMSPDYLSECLTGAASSLLGGWFTRGLGGGAAAEFVGDSLAGAAGAAASGDNVVGGALSGALGHGFGKKVDKYLDGKGGAAGNFGRKILKEFVPGFSEKTAGGCSIY